MEVLWCGDLINKDKDQAVLVFHCLPDAGEEGRHQLAAL
jgi:hypothetical protein